MKDLILIFISSSTISNITNKQHSEILQQIDVAINDDNKFDSSHYYQNDDELLISKTLCNRVITHYTFDQRFDVCKWWRGKELASTLTKKSQSSINELNNITQHLTQIIKRVDYLNNVDVTPDDMYTISDHLNDYFIDLPVSDVIGMLMDMKLAKRKTHVYENGNKIKYTKLNKRGMEYGCTLTNFESCENPEIYIYCDKVEELFELLGIGIYTR